MRLLAAAAALLAAPLSAGDVPSGHEVSLHEVLVDAQDSTTYLRFRFLAPQISVADAGDDMFHLCETVALPYIDEFVLDADTIVISFMDRLIEFGEADPDTTQIFEAFRTENGTCIWDEF